jgi:hypothetical protein
MTTLAGLYMYGTACFIGGFALGAMWQDRR